MTLTSVRNNTTYEHRRLVQSIILALFWQAERLAIRLPHLMGRCPKPLSKTEVHITNNKTRKFAFSISEHDYQTLKTKANLANMTMTDFINKCIGDKPVTVITDLQPLLKELKFVGQSISQQATSTANLSESKKILADIYRCLASLKGDS